MLITLQTWLNLRNSWMTFNTAILTIEKQKCVRLAAKNKWRPSAAAWKCPPTSRPHDRSALRARSHQVQVLAGGKNRKDEKSVRAISNQYKTLWPMMLDSSSITAFLCLQDETKDHVKALKTCWTHSEHFRSLDCNVCNLADLLPHRLKTMHVLSQYRRAEHDCVK